MFKLNKDDLAKKTDAQLSAASGTVNGLIPASPDRHAMQSLLALIAAERAKRGPRP